LAAAAESFLQAIERSNELSAIWSSRVRAANGEAVGEAIAHYAHRSNQPKFTRRDARENARPVVEAVKVYVEQLEAAASPMVEAIIILEESTDDFLSVPWIQTSEDRSWAQYIIDIALDAAKSVNEIARTVEEAGSNWTDALSFRPETKSTAPALQRAVNTHAQLIDLYVAYLLRVADVVEERLEQA
jgi:argininosuccinate lyase